LYKEQNINRKPLKSEEIINTIGVEGAFASGFLFEYLNGGNTDNY
jgi:sugar/nucleoside kinase (ribokinase family)